MSAGAEDAGREGSAVDRRRLNWITWSFVGITVLVLALMLANTLRRPVEIELPDTSGTQDAQDGPLEAGGPAVVEVNPATVQAAIATLARPETYRRTVTVEQFWSGGSGSYEVTEAVRDGWTRTDRTMPDGRVRHTLTGPAEVYVWYNNEAAVYAGPRGEITADNELPIPTYEDILALEPEAITAADYRTLSNVPCIYAEARSGERTLRCWVSVGTGLLVSAEKLEGEELVYRMSALTVEEAAPGEELFTLPDGTKVG